MGFFSVESRRHLSNSRNSRNSRQHLIRAALRAVFRSLSRALVRLTVNGLANVPRSGGLLLVMNHLGDADPIMVIGFTPRDLEVIGKSEILWWPLAGQIAWAYGMIAVRRGEPDRATLKSAVNILKLGRALLIAPEGRESKTQGLQPGKGGAAFLALQSQAPLLPVAITGTDKTYAHWLRLRRPYVTLTFGAPFDLPPGCSRREAADLIMRRIAELLPPEYRGVYK